MKNNKIPTIKDVAKRANISTATVSRAINNTSYVSKEAKKKIDEAIEELGYHSNSLARSLKVNESNTIGLVVTDISNRFFSSIAREMEKSLLRKNYNLIICSTNESEEAERMQLKMLSERRVDGIIICATGKNNQMIRNLVRIRMPVVLIDRAYDDLELDAVYDDNYQGGYRLAKIAIDKGYHNPSIITGHPDSLASNDRVNGFVKAYKEAGIDIKNKYIELGGLAGEFTEKAIDNLLNIENPPDIFFSVNNHIAQRTMYTLNKKHIKIPDQIAMVAYGFEDFTNLFLPSITCVVQRPEIIGYNATKILMNRLKNKDSNIKKEIVFPPEIFIGGSI